MSIQITTSVATTVKTALQFFASSIVNTNSSPITTITYQTFDNSPAFTFMPTVSGRYKVYASIPLEVTSTTNGVVMGRIFNTSGSATLLYESAVVSQGNTSQTSSAYTQSVYTLVAGSTYIFDIQALLISGDGANSSFLRGDLASFYMFSELIG